MLISDCSSDVCSSDLGRQRSAGFSANRSCRSPGLVHERIIEGAGAVRVSSWRSIDGWWLLALLVAAGLASLGAWQLGRRYQKPALLDAVQRSAEHTSELQSLMRICNAGLCLTQ